MLTWFTLKAPIRRKLQIALVAVNGDCAAFPGAIPLPFAVHLVLCGSVTSIIATFLLSRAIAVPYGMTVLRIVALATAKHASPVALTDRTSRLTRAMQTFRNAAWAKIGAHQVSSHLLQVEGSIR